MFQFQMDIPTLPHLSTARTAIARLIHLLSSLFDFFNFLPLGFNEMLFPKSFDKIFLKSIRLIFSIKEGNLLF